MRADRQADRQTDPQTYRHANRKTLHPSRSEIIITALCIVLAGGPLENLYWSSDTQDTKVNESKQDIL